MFKEYLRYLKNNPEGYWFKAKLYGWGWTPATREGWGIFVLFLLFLFWNGWRISDFVEPTQTQLFWFFGRLIFAIALLLLICYKTGERPRWQWGLEKKDK